MKNNELAKHIHGVYTPWVKKIPAGILPSKTNPLSVDADGTGKFGNSGEAKKAGNLAVNRKVTAWAPPKTTTKVIVQKIMVEAAMAPEYSKNSFRLNIPSISVDKAHSKFMFSHNGRQLLGEILYPNASGKITVKVEAKGFDPVIKEVGLEDDAYIAGLSKVIVKMATEVSETIAKQGTGMVDYSQSDLGDPGGGVGGFAPVWESTTSSWNRDMAKISSLMEQEGDSPFGENDFSQSFGDTDFAQDSTNPVTAGDFPAMPAPGEGLAPAGVNQDDGSSGAPGQEETPDEYESFAEKTDWDNASVSTMGKLVAKAQAKTMADGGSGVVLTADEILNGTRASKLQPAHDIIKDFLKVYPELDDDFTQEQLGLIDDKLALDDGQFDSWLAENLSEFKGSEDVDMALNNDMFNDEMAANEQLPPPAEGTEGNLVGDFGDFMDSSNALRNSPEYSDAQDEFGLAPLDEYGNIGAEGEGEGAPEMAPIEGEVPAELPAEGEPVAEEELPPPPPVSGPPTPPKKTK
jgi:hypothetical protein